ncbi:hypothetical protein LCGC14_0979400 [marine sediment metagenome]|uniref:Uncharacterized protein n=1 Tax=marine sediment metagenome TaxID=412755 RepID=A0A0F9N970_9ZZZZ
MSSLRLQALVSQKRVFQLGGGTNSAQGDGSTNDGNNSLTHGDGVVVDSDSDPVTAIGENLKVLETSKRVLFVGADGTIKRAFDVAAVGEDINIGDGASLIRFLAFLGSRRISVVGGGGSRGAAGSGSEDITIEGSYRQVSSDGSRQISFESCDQVSADGSREITLENCNRVSADGSRAVTALRVRDADIQGCDIDVVDTNSAIINGQGHRVGLLAPCGGISISGFDHTVDGTFNSTIDGFRCVMVGASNSTNVGNDNKNEGKRTSTHGIEAHAREDDHKAWGGERNEGLGADQRSIIDKYFTTASVAQFTGHSLFIAPDRSCKVRAEVTAKMTTNGLIATFDVLPFTVGRIGNGPVVILDPALHLTTGGPLVGALAAVGTGRSADAVAAAIAAEVDETPAGATIGPDAGAGFDLTATTITRNDGGDWLVDDKLKKGSFVTIANATNGANDGVHEVTGATAGVLTLGNSILTPTTGDNTITLDKTVDTIDALVEGDPGRTDWHWTWFMTEEKGTA